MKENIFSTQIITISSNMKKFDKCNISQSIDGTYWIVVPSDAKEVNINVFENNIYNNDQSEHNFIIDLLNIEKLIPHELRGRLHESDYKLDESIEKKVNDRILEYVKKYGFLGILQKPKDKHREGIFKSKDNIFEKLYSHTIPLMYNNNVTDNYHLYDSYKFNGTNEIYLIYKEPIYIILDAIEAFYRFKKNWDYYINNKIEPTDSFQSLFNEPMDSKTTWQEYFKSFGFSKYDVFDVSTRYDISLECGVVNKLHYSCESLIDLIKLYLLNEIVFDNQVISFCKTCGGAFIKRNPKKEYCSNTCRSYHNVNKLRGKNSLKS